MGSPPASPRMGSPPASPRMGSPPVSPRIGSEPSCIPLESSGGSPPNSARGSASSPMSPRALSFLRAATFLKRKGTGKAPVQSAQSMDGVQLISMVSGIPEEPFPKFFLEQLTGLWTKKEALHWMSSITLVESSGKERSPPTNIPEEIMTDLGPLVVDEEVDVNTLSIFVVLTFRDFRTPIVLVFRKKHLRDTFIQLIQTVQKVFHFPVALSDVD